MAAIHMDRLALAKLNQSKHWEMLLVCFKFDATFSVLRVSFVVCHSHWLSVWIWLGRQVLVFNCDEGIDFQSMGRIFIGLVKSGAWGCFDEFNRLTEDQLSAISQQIQVIQAALKARDPQVELLGLSFDHSVICVAHSFIFRLQDNKCKSTQRMFFLIFFPSSFPPSHSFTYSFILSFISYLLLSHGLLRIMDRVNASQSEISFLSSMCVLFCVSASCSGVKFS